MTLLEHVSTLTSPPIAADEKRSPVEQRTTGSSATRPFTRPEFWGVACRLKNGRRVTFARQSARRNGLNGHYGKTEISRMRTVRSNKELKLTRPVQIGASQLNPRVVRT